MSYLLQNVLIVAGTLLSTFGFIMALFLFASLKERDMAPSATMAWLMGFIFLPIIAVPLYFSFGLYRKRRLRRKNALDYSINQEDIDFIPKSALQRSLATLPHAPPVVLNNRTEYLFDGIESYERLMEEIERAERDICFTTFILSPDEIGKAIVAALAKKAREGVKVRLLIDSLGSWKARGRFIREFQEAGGEVARFMPVLPFRRRSGANLRMHRKLYLFDGCRAILGGKNLGRVYMGPQYDAQRWVDTLVFVEGPAVKPLIDIFRADWSFATDQEIEIPSVDPKEDRGDACVQVVAGGPDAEEHPLYEAMITALMGAQRRIWVVTPYFVPDETVHCLLAMHAKVGHDVRLIVPAKSDHRVADLARAHSLRKLREAGVKVLFFRPQMIHAKLMLVDDDVAMIGSPNMDMRSLYLNFELAMLVYSAEDVKHIEQFIEELQTRTSPYRRRESRVGNYLEDLQENLARLLSPLI